MPAVIASDPADGGVVGLRVAVTVILDQITHTTAWRTRVPSQVSSIGNFPDAALDSLAVRPSAPTAGDVIAVPVATQVKRLDTSPGTFGEICASRTMSPVFFTQQKCSSPAAPRLLAISCV